MSTTEPPTSAGCTKPSEVTVEVEPTRQILVGLIGEDGIAALDDDLVGAMAYAIGALRRAPVEKRMEAMGMTAVSHDYDGTHVEDGPMEGRTIDDYPEDATLFMSIDGASFMHVWGDDDRCVHCNVRPSWLEEDADA